MNKVNQAWLYGAVKPYFEKNGIKLLKDDLLHIERCLSHIPPDRHKFVMRDYFNTWNTKTMENHGVESRVLSPRYKANIFLLNASGMPN